MTDDISKVVREMRDSCANGGCQPPVRCDACHWASRLESAAAPVEVSWVPSAPPPPFVSEDYAAGWNAAQTVGNDKLCTLARQLAEAKADTATATRCHAITREHLEQAESQLAEATRRLGEVEIDAARWQRWLPWLMQLNKKPFNLAKELDAIAALTKEPTK